MFKLINGLLDRMCAAAGAILFLQAPLFIRQYMQQLSGHTEELRIQVQAMQKAATHSGKTLAQYIQKFIESGDVDYAHQGEIMLSLVERWHNFSETLAALQNSSVFSRPFLFLSNLNWDIFKSTWHNFAFGLPFNLEGIVYAAAGIIFGLTVYYLMRSLCLAFWRKTLYNSPVSH